ncbi:MAG: hypothetical protein IPL53_19510 [Ignavibacteria bacterium]|nr:hypothetical protein [Ignavibacteria bacterium]
MKRVFKSSKFYYGYFGDYLEPKQCRFRVEAYDVRLHTKLISAGISELMIFDFLAKFSNNFNNYYIGLTEFNEKPENDFIDRFSKALFSDKELGKLYSRAERRTDNNYKIINIFFRLMKCYLNPDDIEYYYDFKKTLYDNDRYISESGMRGLYASLGSALDNCNDVSGINKNRELYEIINHLAEKNIFLSEEGKTIPTLYLFSVKTAGYLKETAFIERAIKEYLPKTDPELQDNFKTYSLAYLHYSKSEFDKALEYTNKISIDTFQMKYFLRNLQIIISYEKDDYDMFQYLSDSYRHFLSKNKSVSSGYKESNMKFLNYTNTLFKLREADDRSEAGFIESSLPEIQFK